MRCTLMKNSFTLFCFEETAVTGDTVLLVMQNTALHHVSWKQFPSQMVYYFTFPLMFLPFWTGSFLTHLDPLVLQT